MDEFIGPAVFAILCVIAIVAEVWMGWDKRKREPEWERKAQEFARKRDEKETP